MDIFTWFIGGHLGSMRLLDCASIRARSRVQSSISDVYAGGRRMAMLQSRDMRPWSNILGGSTPTQLRLGFLDYHGHGKVRVVRLMIGFSEIPAWQDAYSPSIFTQARCNNVCEMAALMKLGTKFYLSLGYDYAQDVAPSSPKHEP